jgi:hypothetical protein
MSHARQDSVGEAQLNSKGPPKFMHEGERKNTYALPCTGSTWNLPLQVTVAFFFDIHGMLHQAGDKLFNYFKQNDLKFLKYVQMVCAYMYEHTLCVTTMPTTLVVNSSAK